MISELTDFIKQYKEEELEDVFKALSAVLLDVYYEGEPNYHGICLNNRLKDLRLCDVCQQRPVDKSKLAK